MRPSGRSFRRILIPLDPTSARSLSPSSARAVEHALALGPRLGASLVVLYSSGGADLAALRERFGAVGLPAEVDTASDRASAVLPGVRDDDLVIFGEPDPSGAQRPRITAFARSILRDRPCPVWAVKSASAPVPRRIVAAADLTATGARIVETAIDLADRCGAHLDVVHTFQRPLAVQMEGESGRFEREQVAQRRRALERQIAASGSRREVGIRVGVGAPTHAILAYARRHAPDLVVAGGATHRGFARFVLGSTAERLLGRLAGSLLVLPP